MASTLENNTTTIDELITMANNLPDAGGGEDISTETAEYTAQLDELEATIDGLPTAGGGSVETCTLSPDVTHTTSMTVWYTSYENGEFNANIYDIPNEGAIINNVVKNSSMCFIPGLTKATNMEPIRGEGFIAGLDNMCYKITGDATYARVPCFVTGTRITLANGTTKPVEEITYNNELLVWDFDNGCYSTAKPLWIKKEQVASYYYRCTFEDGTILKLVGSNGKCHRLFDFELNRFESATDCVGKMVYTIGGEKKLVSCERIDEEVKFYNIITEYHFNLFAENILTSCRLNNLYPIENMKYVKEDRELIPFEAYPDATLGLYKGLRLGERKSEDVSMINEYVNRLLALSASKEV